MAKDEVVIGTFPLTDTKDNDQTHGVPELTVAVYYAKGGANYFSGRTEPRGIYLSATPSRVREVQRIPGPGTLTIRSSTAFSGTKSLLEETGRASPKVLAKWAAACTAELNERTGDTWHLVERVLEKNRLLLKETVTTEF